MSGLLQRRRRRPELNLVPLIDVLVMLIFFAFVTMQFRSAVALNITMPKIDTAGKNELKGNITISVDKDDNITFNGKPVAEDQLLDLLDQQHNTDPDFPVLLKIDEQTHVKQLTFVMDACRKAALTNISLESRQ